jgi:phage terminase large subunit-like protein
VHVHLASGGASTTAFKTYEAGREAFQSATVHVMWLDEEPDFPIYVEALMCTATTGGIVLATFTPLRGLQETALHFLPGRKVPDAGTAGPFVTFIEWADIPHLSDQAKAILLASIPLNVQRALELAAAREVPPMECGRAKDRSLGQITRQCDQRRDARRVVCSEAN